MKYLISILCLFVFSCDTAANIFGISRSDHSHSCKDGAEFTESGYYCDDWEFIEDLYNCNGDECTDAYVSNLNSFQENSPSNYISWFNGRITEIIINFADFESIPKSIGNLDYLTKFTFSNTRISELPDEIVLLPLLEQLWISNNLLTNLPDDIGELSNLKLLFINNNQITKLPDSIVNLEELIYHDFSHNHLTELPDNINLIFQNTEISNSAFGSPNVINFSNNKLSVLPESFFNLDNIYSIDLRYNQLTTLPESVCGSDIEHIKTANNLMCNSDNLPTCFVPNYSTSLHNHFCIDSNCESGYSLYDGNWSIDSHNTNIYYDDLEYYCIDKSNLKFLEDFISINNELNIYKPHHLQGLTWTIDENSVAKIVSINDNFLYTHSYHYNDIELLIPESIDNLNNLKSILFDNYSYHSYKVILNLPATFGSLIQLTDLAILDDYIVEELPVNFGQLISLENLILVDIGLTVLPNNFTDLHLTILDLSDNLLTDLPHNFCDIDYLDNNAFNVSYNKLCEINLFNYSCAITSNQDCN